MVKEFLKSISRNQLNSAFTFWEFYSPKRPKILEQMIEERKEEKSK